jgi:hypothetical protein
VQFKVQYHPQAWRWAKIVKKTKPSSYRLPEKISNLISILSEKLLISKTAVITLAVLLLAKKEDIDDDSP